MSTLIGLRDVTVEYPGNRALDQVTLDINPGEVLAIVGANGSGKTTLLSVLTGQRRPTSGSVVGPDGDIVFDRPAAALAAGVALVPQEPLMAPTLPAWENLIVGQTHLWRPAPNRATRASARDRVREVLPHVDPDIPAGELRKADRAVLGLARGMLTDPHVLALDEPTAVLGDRGVELVEQITRGVTARGGAVVIVSHRLRDIVRLADRVAVLVDGKLKLDAAVADVSIEEIIDSLAAGRGVAVSAHERPTDAPVLGEDVLSVTTDRSHSGLEVSDLSVRSGEIVGLVGMAGSGRTRLCKLVAGVLGDPQGVRFRGGRPPRSARAARRAGIAYIPEDRLNEGLFPPLSVAMNIEVGDLVRRSLASVTRFSPSKSATQRAIDRFGIKTPSQSVEVTALSGGNAQRVVIARELMNEPRLLVADEPTQGVDRAGRAAIHDLMRDFVLRGGGVLVVSSEFEELQEIASRLYVMVDGRVVADVPADTPYARLVALASGLDDGASAEQDIPHLTENDPTRNGQL
ncbi:ATP-binding cassette domain-containing protein [Microbacterium sp. ASV49]|uniref:ATP-binding cassette domain-containing protein n=1 Tax=Microbacterium candidum TaxID=3041922 RepID=A0ABT7MW49_9MICO|nr:ATP-binding cassette domain-containing protein [Microbacterium sp. ASV49]MDL9978687.1 ATP-binding cassette domain-containing protein [Microbacterium sp. ASV49]